MSQGCFKSKHIHVAVTTIIIFLASGYANAAQWKGSEIVRDNRRHVINPSTPVEVAVTYETVKAWRVGGDDDDDVLFGLIDDVARDASGKSYLLDSQLCEVHVIFPDGGYQRSIGRSGEGPGEFRTPSNVMLFSDGTVCVLQVMPGRAVLLTSTGEASGDHPLPRGTEGSHLYVNGGTIAKDQMVLKLGEFIRKETSFGLKTSFVRIGPDGKVIVKYWDLLREQDLAKVTFDEKADAEPVWAASSDGRFFVNNDWDRYSIEVYASDGTFEHVIERDYDHRKRTPRDFERINGLMQAGQISSETKVSETSRDVLRMFPRDDGSLWILSSSGGEDVATGVIATFDVFNSEGRFVRQITVRGPYRTEKDVFHVVGNFIFVVTNAGESAGEASNDTAEGTDGDIGPMEVICLRIAEGP